MGKIRKNQSGFSAVEVLLALIFVAIVVFIGVYVAHNNKSSKSTATTSSTSAKSPTASTTNFYAGWKTDSTSLTGVSFKYPSTWTVATPNSPQCTGAVDVTVTAPSSEVSQAITASQYYLSIERYGTQSSSCAPDGTDFSSLQFDSVNSSDQVKSGIFSGNWLSFFIGGNNQFYPSQLDNAVLTASSYNGSQKSIGSSSTVTASGKTYQVGIVTSTASGQTETPASTNLTSFKSSNLYKDTLNILNSAN